MTSWRPIAPLEQVAGYSLPRWQLSKTLPPTRPARLRAGQKGQALTEATVFISTLSLLIIFFAQTVGLSVSRLWLEKIIYETSQCALQNQSNCRAKARSAISSLSWGQLIQLDITKRLNAREMRTVLTSLTWCFYKNGSQPCRPKNQLRLAMKLEENKIVDSRSLVF